MKKNILCLPMAGLLAVAMVLAPVAGLCQDKPKNAPGSGEAAKPAPAEGAVPFRGKIAAVDKSAMTFTVGERVFHVTSETKITRSGKPATLADAVVGDAVAGNYLKGDDGKLTAKMVRFGPKPNEGEKVQKKTKPNGASNPQ